MAFSAFILLLKILLLRIIPLIFFFFLVTGFEVLVLSFQVSHERAFLVGILMPIWASLLQSTLSIL
jgi:hypothetical protein